MADELGPFLQYVSETLATGRLVGHDQCNWNRLVIEMDQLTHKSATMSHERWLSSLHAKREAGSIGLPLRD